MSASLKTLPAVMRHPAQAGDLIQYQFYVTRWGVRETHLDTRRVVTVFDSGASFVVEGGYQIRAAQITAHIPMRDAEPQEETDYGWCGASKS